MQIKQARITNTSSASLRSAPFTSVDAPLLSLCDISPVKRGNLLKGKAIVVKRAVKT